MSARKPAEGERRAIGGYMPQYGVAASAILLALREERLHWVKLADPAAGRVDDLQLGSQARVDAYQAKWSKHPSAVSFRDLTTASKDGPPLIAQLADGWERLRREYPASRVIVHLITNDRPSTGDSLPVGATAPTPRHFGAFLEQAWRPTRAESLRDEESVPLVWREAWATLQTASDLAEADFMDFIRDCELDFDARLPAEETTTRDQEIWLQDYRDLQRYLLRTVADPAHIVTIARDDLLRDLGWRARAEFYSRHEFPVDDTLYRPIAATERHLEDSLSQFTHGYLAVLGTPGSGKSSLLTQTLRSRPERVIRYYAYVPDAHDPIVLRGESTSFLHDVTTALDRAGFSEGHSLPSGDRRQLLERFHSQVRRLGDDWRATGRKTIIMIDGLDHIAREQHPSRSLLDDLPAPDQIPEGALFLLGSQTDDPFPAPVRASLRGTGRRIEMQPLGRDEVFEIVDRAPLAVAPTAEQKEQIYRRSTGHPLALAYLLNQLLDSSQPVDVQEILDGAEQYTGSIEAQYQSYWDACAREDELAHLLGLLARIRGSIDLDWIGTWINRATLQSLLRPVAYYFRRETPARWYFFHNSFRLFLVQRTAEGFDGSFDDARDRSFHRELADRCAGSPAASHWRWEELYHRMAAGEIQAALAQATPAWFRRQILAFRPLDAVRADLGLALRVAADRHDPVVLARLILTGSEVTQRDRYLDDLPLARLLLRLGLVDEALEYVRDGNRLRVGLAEALHLTVMLKELGRLADAQCIFELAEPLDLLSPAAAIEDDHNDEKRDALVAWAGAAPAFRPVREIIDRTRRVRYGQGRNGQDDAEAETVALQDRMLYAAGRALVDAQRWEDLRAVADALWDRRGATAHPWFWLHVRAWQERAVAGDDERARRFVDRVAQATQEIALDQEEIVTLAEGVYRVLGDERSARDLIADVAHPDLTVAAVPLDAGFRPFERRFHLHRLRVALGDSRTPAEIIPDADNPRHQGLVYAERAVCIVAWIWGEAWRGRRLDGATIVRESTLLLHLFDDPVEATRRWMAWYSAEQARPELYALFVRAAALHGSEARDAVVGSLERRWEETSSELSWPLDVRRQVILAAYRAGKPQSWAEERLGALEPLAREGRGVDERIREHRRQTEARLALGDKEAARRQLDEIMRASFGVAAEDDYQVMHWIDWLVRVNKVEPERGAARIAWFAGALLGLDGRAEGRTIVAAAARLLYAAFVWSPRRAVTLFRWMIEHGLVRQNRAELECLRAALDRDDAPPITALTVLSSIVLAMDTEADSDFAQLLVATMAARQGTDAALTVARCLVMSVGVLARARDRHAWRLGIARALGDLGVDLQGAGLDPEDLRPVDDAPSSDELTLTDGAVLSLDEVLIQVRDAPALDDLMRRAAPDSFFDWTPVVERVAAGLGPTGIAELATMFGDHRRAPRILAALSERLVVLGDRPAAWALGERALGASHPLGWGHWYDGGSRSSAFAALIQADGPRARAMAYRMLCLDLADNLSWGLHRVALDLDELLPLVADPLPIQEIWAEIEGYVQELFVSLAMPQDKLPHLNESSLGDSAEGGLIDLLLWHLDHPVRTIVQAAQRAVGALLLAGNRPLINSVPGALRRSDRGLAPLLVVLDAVSVARAEALAPFDGVLAEIQASDDYSIRLIAQTIRKRMGTWTPQPMANAPLPTAYQIALPPDGMGFYLDGPTAPRGQPVPDSQDPLQIVRPFNHWIEAIADAARLPMINVCYRIVQIMDRLAPRDTWSADGERRVRWMLDAAGLRLTFQRPRPLLARRALFHAVAELVDAGTIEPRDQERLERRLRFYDPRMVLAQSGPRPAEVAAIADRPDRGARGTQWLEQTTALDQEPTRMNDGRVILASHATLHLFDWQSPTERRSNVVTPIGVGSEGNDSIAMLRQPLIAEYPSLGRDSNPPPIIVQSRADEYDSPGDDWIAFNPAVGHAVGWTVDPNGLFRWVDDAGATMVETLWWADGPAQEPMRRGGADEVGSGWMVVADANAWAALADRYCPLRRRLDVTRELDLDDEDHDHERVRATITRILAP